MLLGGIAGAVDLILFSALFYPGVEVVVAAPVAFLSAAIVNYFLCVLLLFRHRSRWGPAAEQLVYWLFAGVICVADLGATLFFLHVGAAPWIAKLLACLVLAPFNFIGRRFLVFSDAEGGARKARGERRSK